MSVALLIQYTTCMLSIIISSVACTVVQYFHTLSHKQHDFRGEKLWNIKHVFWICLHFFLKYLSLVRRLRRDIIKTYIRFYVKYRFNDTRIFSTDLRKKKKILRYKILWKSVQLFHSQGLTDRQTDMTKLIAAFRCFAKSASNRSN